MHMLYSPLIMEEASPLGTAFQQPVSHSQQPKKRSWKKALLVLVVLALLGFGGYNAMAYFLGSGTPEQPKIEITPTPTIEEIQETPTETPTPEESPQPKADQPLAETARPTTSPIDKATGLDRRELSIEVQNGSGEKGVAGKVADFLKSFGYKISGTKNADNFDYTNVTISIKESSSNYLSLLKKDLNTEYTVGDTNSTLSASSSADAVVIVGK